MNETTTGTTGTSHLPPILPPQQPAGGEQRTSSSEPFFASLRTLPARRTDRAVLGGVCATIADRLDISPAAVRAVAALSVLALGVGVGLYLIAWAVLPDATGRTHLEQGLRHGRAASLLVLVLGAFAAIGVLSGGLKFLAAVLPALIGLAALGLLGWWAWTGLDARSRTTS